MAKKNGRKKIRKIKPGKNLPEKISGKLWAENLPANLFEKKNPEKENGNQTGLTPEEYLCLFRRASMIAGKHDQKSCWAYMGMLVQERLEELAQYSQPPGSKDTRGTGSRARAHTRPQERQEATHSTATRAHTAAGRRGHARTRQPSHQAARMHRGTGGLRANVSKHKTP